MQSFLNTRPVYTKFGTLSLGGKTTIIGQSERCADVAWIDIENTFDVERFDQGWIVAVRPDKVVIAEGYLKDADNIVQSVAKLMQ